MRCVPADSLSWWSSMSVLSDANTNEDSDRRLRLASALCTKFFIFAIQSAVVRHRERSELATVRSATLQARSLETIGARVGFVATCQALPARTWSEGEDDDNYQGASTFVTDHVVPSRASVTELVRGHVFMRTKGSRGHFRWPFGGTTLRERVDGSVRSTHRESHTY